MKILFRPNGLIMPMIQPDPLPGSYRHDGATIDEIVMKTIKEVDMVVENGYKGIMIQNMNDMPVKQTSRPEAIAYMTRIGYEIKQKYPDLIIGVLLNWDGVASLAVAHAMGADFVRVEHLFTGVNVTSAGFLEGQCVEIAEFRKRTDCKIPVYADIFEVHGVPIGAKPVEFAAWEAVHEGFADGLFLAGKTPTESIEMIKKVRTKLPDTPIILGGGATGENIAELMKYYDGVTVATWIKNGDMKNPISSKRSQTFIEEAERGYLNNPKKKLIG